MSIQLIDCPACGNKVSSQAVACPHCGQPIRLTPRPVSRPAEKSPSAKPGVSNARVLSILSIVFTAGVFFGDFEIFGLLFIVAGIVLGHLAVKKGDNLGKVGYVCGYIALGLVMFVFFDVFGEYMEKIPAKAIVGFLVVLTLIIKAIAGKKKDNDNAKG